MIVVDTNIICYHWIRSPHSSAAEQALRKDSAWIAPILWRSEFRSALSIMLRQRLISLTLAEEIATRAEAQFTGHEFFVGAREVLRLVAQSRCSAYDCEFVALAQEQSVALVTVDRQILREFPAVAISLETFIGS